MTTGFVGGYRYDPSGAGRRSRLAAQIIEEERRRREEEERRRKAEQERLRRQGVATRDLQVDSTRFRGLEGQELREAREGEEWATKGPWGMLRRDFEEPYKTPIEEGELQDHLPLEHMYNRSFSSALRGEGRFVDDEEFLEGELRRVKRSHPRNYEDREDYGVFQALLARRKLLEREENPSFWGRVLGSELWHGGLGGALLGFGRESLRAGWYFGGLVAGRDSLHPARLPQALESESMGVGGIAGTIAGSIIPGALGLMPEIHAMIAGDADEVFPGERLLTVATLGLGTAATGTAAVRGGTLGPWNAMRIATGGIGKAERWLDALRLGDPERYYAFLREKRLGQPMPDLPPGAMPWPSAATARGLPPLSQADRGIPYTISGGARDVAVDVLKLPLKIEPGLTKRDEMVNAARAFTVGVTGKISERALKHLPDFLKVQKDPTMTTALEIYRRGVAVGDNVATAISTKHAAALKRAFTFEEVGPGKDVTIPELEGIDKRIPGAPALADVIDRLPIFLDHLTDEQIQAIRGVEDTLRLFTEAHQAKGLGARSSIMEGGFYFPRGATVIDDGIYEGTAHSSSNLGLQTSRRGGKEFFEHEAVFDSMAEGIQKGHVYAGIEEVLSTFVRGQSRIAARDYVTRFLKTTHDPQTGKPFAREIDPKTPKHTQAQLDAAKYKVQSAQKYINVLQKAIAGYTIPTRSIRTIEKLFPSIKGALDDIARVTTEDLIRAGKEAAKPPKVFDMPTPGTLRKYQNLLDEALAQAELTGRLEDQAKAKAIARSLGFAKFRWKKGRAILEEGEAPTASFTAEGKFVVAKQPPRILKGIKAQALRDVRDLIRGKRVAGKKGWRGGLLSDLREEVNMLKTQAKNEKKRLRPGRDYAPLPPGAFGGMPGHVFPEEAAAQALMWANQARGLKGPLIGILNEINNLYRGLRATMDLSGPGIQGLIASADRPQAWGGAFKAQLHSLKSQEALGEFLINYDNMARARGRFTSYEWAQRGLRLGGGNTEFMLGGEGLAGQFGKLPLIKQANRAFGNFGDELRLNWADEYLNQELKKGRTIEEINLSGDMERIAEIVNKMTGYTKDKAFGNFGDLLLFAPRFLQSRLETLTEAAMSLRPGASLSQRAARWAMVKMVGYGTALTFLANAKLGNETDVKPLVQLKDGKWVWNSNFMRIRWAGRDWSIFGTWDSLARGIASVSMGRPLEFFESMPSGTVAVGWQTLSGENAIGESVPSMTSQKDEWLTWLATQFTPFSADEGFSAIGQFAQGMAKGDLEDMLAGGSTAMGEMLGLKSAPMALTDFKDLVSLKRYGVLYRDLIKEKNLGEEKGKLAQKEIDKSPEVLNSPAQQRRDEEQNRRSAKLHATGPSQEAWTMAADGKNAATVFLKSQMTDGKIPDRNLFKAVGEFKRQIYTASANLFRYADTPDADTEPELFRAKYWNIALEWEAGQPLYAKFEDEKQRVLNQASVAGVSKDFITARSPYDDPEVNRAVTLADEIDETLKEYYTVHKQNPWYGIPEYQEFYNQWSSSGYRGKSWQYFAGTTSPYANKRVFNIMKAIDKWVTKQREMMRKRDPDLDVLLVRYRGYTPKSALGKLASREALSGG